MVRRGWWTHVLWPELRRAVSEGGALRGQDPEGRKACRPAHRAAHKIRVRHQPQDRESTWPDHSAVGARAGRSSHRISGCSTNAANSCEHTAHSSGLLDSRQPSFTEVPMRRIGLAVVLALGLSTVPLAIEAQPAKKAPRIGYLSVGAAVVPEVFVQRLRELGYSDKQNIAIEYRFGEGKHEVMSALARDLVGLNVDVIMAFGDEAIVAAKQTTTTIPIVMFACDALTVGFVASLARPGGNVTGVTCLTTELTPKRVALLREAVPKVSRVGLLYNPANVSKPPEAERTRIAAQGLGLKMQTQ